MARIAGVNIPTEKRVEVALTAIYGIGPATSQKVLSASRINPDTRVKDLTEPEIAKIREVIEKDHQVEGDLSRLVSLNINRLKEINAYRGLRHKAGLPVHGQRTKTNARTKRGKKVTMGSGRKKSAAKT
ncbi:MAG TPA: 30S ribosomal protein S13 [Candidatus Saccharimonadales bacterium]|nr:30S ribosomal protein S13 [Candidatus Saccharimonadales bacterium]